LKNKIVGRSQMTIVIKKKSLRLKLLEDKWCLAFLTPTIVLLFMFSYIPMFGLAIAFQNYQLGRPIIAFDGSVIWVGFKHFKDFLTSIFFKRVFTNTIRLSVTSLAWGFWVPIVFAILLNEIRVERYKRVVQTLVYLPHFISMVIVVALLTSLTSPTGVINGLIEALGGKTINFMREPEWFDFLYVFSGIWKSFGYSSIIYLAAIASIDQNLYEAVTIDGGNRFHRMWHITIPCIIPTIIILLILSIGNLLGASTEKILLMYNPATMDKADVIGTYVYRTGIVAMRLSYTAAVGFFINVVNFCLIVVSNLLSRKVAGHSLW
jgi:putative aldouronate transport system permease protein